MSKKIDLREDHDRGIYRNLILDEIMGGHALVG